MNKKKILTVEENFVLALQNHKKNNYENAKKFYIDALKLNPNYLAAHNNLGILFNQLGEYQKATKCFEKVIQINQNDSVAHNNLGNIHKKLGEYQKAIKCFEKAIEIKPKYSDAFYNLANTLNEIGEHQKAIKCFEKAIEILPNNTNAFFNLGNIYKNLGEYQKAINYFEKVIQIQPNYADAYNNLGITLNEIGEYDKAISYIEKAIQINPKYIDAHNNLGNIQKKLGEHQIAKSLYEKATQIDPDNLTSHWLSMNIFPVIYENLDEIDQYRKNFANKIKKVNLMLEKQSQYSKKKLLNALNSSTNFYLHYQGRDVLELQQNYARLIEKITQNVYKKFHKQREKNVSSKYIRIGFVSSFFRKHTISKLFKNWIIKIDKKYFKKFVYYVGNKFDDTTKEIRQNANYFFYHSDIDKLIDQISLDKLDILIYLDIGMKSKIQILSSLRLAPIQCNTWGHPVTSGFKNIDYYLSGELMENKNSQNCYSEKLIVLPNLGINYDFPNLSNIIKPKLLNKSNATIFLNIQSLFKLLPQDDHIYLDILKKNSNINFWFINGENSSVTNLFKERISKLFTKEGYDFKKYTYFHPKCNQEEFFGIIEESDIILDSLNWSGGNTSLEAISLNKPIVTCPSAFMRGRHTYGILKILAIEETIAVSKKEYVDIAAKLASDINFRNFIINKIKKNKHKLFNDDKPIKFLEDTIRKKML